MMHDSSAFSIRVDESDSGRRLDVVITFHIPDCSRSYAATLINEGKVRVQGVQKKPGYRVKSGDDIQGHIPPPTPILFKPEPIDIDICYEDDDLLVINKPPGLVVHPAPGHYTGTLVNALLNHCPDLSGIGGKIRPGIVHRLDKDTSGVLIIAKTASTLDHLSAQFKTRKIKKEYLAVVYGETESASGVITFPIGRHRVDRKRMSVTSHNGREAETLWRVKERFDGATLLEVNPRTGRTHQIRVHCAAIHHPIIGDSVYGLKKKAAKKQMAGKRIADRIQSVSRQMLHAWRINFTHPATEKRVQFETPVPQDMMDLIKELR